MGFKRSFVQLNGGIYCVTEFFYNQKNTKLVNIIVMIIISTTNNLINN